MGTVTPRCGERAGLEGGLWEALVCGRMEGALCVCHALRPCGKGRGWVTRSWEYLRFSQKQYFQSCRWF